MKICAECDYTGTKAGFSAHYRHSGHNRRGKNVSGKVIPCATCGTGFYEYKNQRYCSPACKPLEYNLEPFTCAECGKDSTGYRGKIYCSRKCSLEGTKPKKCGQCDYTSRDSDRLARHRVDHT